MRKMGQKVSGGISRQFGGIPIPHGLDDGSGGIAGAGIGTLHFYNLEQLRQFVASATATGEVSGPFAATVLDVYQDFIRPSRLDVLLSMPPPPRDVQIAHAWNPDDRSMNIFVKEDDLLTFHRHPVAQSTDCIRGRVGYTRGFHVWEIQWPQRQRGTHAVVGVSTTEASLHAAGYSGLIGSNTDSWGWDIGRKKLYHDTKTHPPVSYPILVMQPHPVVAGGMNHQHAAADGNQHAHGAGAAPGAPAPDDNFAIPDVFQVALDMDEGTLAFLVDGQYLGVAFRGLKGKKLYPIVSAVWGHCEITMRYLGGLDRKFYVLLVSECEYYANTVFFCRVSVTPIFLGVIKLCCFRFKIVSVSYGNILRCPLSLHPHIPFSSRATPVVGHLPACDPPQPGP